MILFFSFRNDTKMIDDNFSQSVILLLCWIEISIIPKEAQKIQVKGNDLQILGTIHFTENKSGEDKEEEMKNNFHSSENLDFVYVLTIIFQY